MHARPYLVAGEPLMQEFGYELPRILLPRTPLNRGKTHTQGSGCD
jgi:hypothetical protein